VCTFQPELIIRPHFRQPKADWKYIAVDELKANFIQVEFGDLNLQYSNELPRFKKHDGSFKKIRGS